MVLYEFTYINEDLDIGEVFNRIRANVLLEAQEQGWPSNFVWEVNLVQDVSGLFKTFNVTVLSSEEG